MDVLMGLIAAVCWGVTDYLVGVNGRAVGVKRSVLYSQLIGFLIVSLFLVLSSTSLNLVREADLETLVICLAAAVLVLLGAICLTKALTQGRTAVVAPLITSYGIVTTILAWLGGELLIVEQLIGIAVCSFGVFLVGLGCNRTESSLRGLEKYAICYALLAAILYGGSFWLQGKYALPSVGPVNMLWLTYFVGVMFIFLTFRDTAGASVLNLRVCGSLSAASIFNLGGFAAFSFGVLEGSVAVVTVISTLSGGVAAVLGYVFYNERLVRGQLLGVLLVLIGAVMLHVL
ncbi:EamA family transporter [Pseudomonas sp. NY11955]|uniref:EamA family transporter n=1 Tax=Pseudomonas sp. NY11955 TaxID=3400363 RepID=UPI003A83CD85